MFDPQMPNVVPLQGGSLEIRAPDEKLMLHNEGWCLRAYVHQGCAHAPADFRTHVFTSKFNHPEIQDYYPAPPAVVISTFLTIANLIVAGARFTDGATSEDVAHNLTVKFIAVKIDGKDYLRMIIPDESGMYEEGEMAEPFRRQYLNRVL